MSRKAKFKEVNTHFNGTEIDFTELAKKMDVDISLYPHLRAGFQKLPKEKQKRYRELQKKQEEFLKKASKFNVGVADTSPPKEFLDLQRKANTEIYPQMEELEAEMQSLQTRPELQAELQKHEELLGKFRKVSEKEIEAKDKRVAKLQAEVKELVAPKEKVKLPRKTYEIMTRIFKPGKIPPGTQLPLVFTEKKGQEQYSFEVKGPHAKAGIYIPREIIGDKTPSLSLMLRSYYDSVDMATQQGSDTIRFTITDKLKRLGYSDKRRAKGGKIYEEQIAAEKGKAALTLHYENDARGKDHIQVIGSLSTIWIEGEGKGTIYTERPNPSFLEGLDFETGKIEGQRIDMPIALLTDRTMSTYERNIRMELLRYIGLSRLPVYGIKFLQWAGLPPSRLKKKSYREKIYLLVLRVFKDMGFEIQHRDYKGKPKDFRKWLFIIAPPRGRKGKGKGYQALDKDAKEFIKRFVEWQSRTDKRRSKGEIRRQITNVILADGLEITLDLFEAINRTSDPTPYHFWTERKRRKALKGGYDVLGMPPWEKVALEADGTDSGGYDLSSMSPSEISQLKADGLI